MEAEEFQLVRDMLRTFAGRFRTDTADVKDATRTAAQQALQELGLAELRRTSPPAATVQECVLLAEEHARHPLTTSLLGTALLAPELLRLLDAPDGAAGATPTVALAADLRFPTAAPTPASLLAWDCDGADAALAVGPDGTVTTHALGPVATSEDLLRSVRTVTADAPSGAAAVIGRLDPGQLAHWRGYALTILAAELVGAARSFVEQAVDYARDRRQYGRQIGSFQAVQHLLADATVAVEAATSATRYAAWSLDNEPPQRALAAARVAKAEANASGQDAVYTGMQVFGGIAQTWEHISHLYLRRVLLGARTLATTTDLLTALAVPEPDAPAGTVAAGAGASEGETTP